MKNYYVNDKQSATYVQGGNYWQGPVSGQVSGQGVGQRQGGYNGNSQSNVQGMTVGNGYRNSISGGTDFSNFDMTGNISANIYTNHSSGNNNPTIPRSVSFTGEKSDGNLPMTSPGSGIPHSISLSNTSEYYDYDTNTINSSSNSNFGLNNLTLTNSDTNSRNTNSYKKNQVINSPPPNYKMNNLSKNFNINAPSYIPKNYYEQTNPSDYDVLQSDLQKLKVDLILKQQIIKNLTEQINQNNKNKSKILTSLYDSKEVITLSNNHLQLYSNLSKKLNLNQQELTETKTRLETLLLAYSITNTNPYYNSTFTKDGAFDEQELTHKILTKLQILQQENQTLLKLISFGNKSSLLIELNMLKQENEKLKEQLNHKK